MISTDCFEITIRYRPPADSVGEAENEVLSSGLRGAPAPYAELAPGDIERTVIVPCPPTSEGIAGAIDAAMEAIIGGGPEGWDRFTAHCTGAVLSDKSVVIERKA